MKRVIRKEDSAVSPIIGTVLLIAITVTLAASLYTVLGSYFNNLPQSSPTVSLKVINGTSSPGNSVNGSYTLFVTYTSNNVSNDNVEIMLSMNNTDQYTFMLSSVGADVNSTMQIYNGSSGNITATYSGTAGYLTPSSSLKITEKNMNAYISRISLIDKRTDSSMGYINIIS